MGLLEPDLLAEVTLLVRPDQEGELYLSKGCTPETLAIVCQLMITHAVAVARAHNIGLKAQILEVIPK